MPAKKRLAGMRFLGIPLVRLAVQIEEAIVNQTSSIIFRKHGHALASDLLGAKAARHRVRVSGFGDQRSRAVFSLLHAVIACQTGIVDNTGGGFAISQKGLI